MGVSVNCPKCGGEARQWRETWQTLFGDDVWHLVSMCRACGWLDDLVTTGLDRE